MNGFLANLAGLALGQPSADAARLSMPPRFSGGPQPDIDSSLELVESLPAGKADRPPSIEPSNKVEIQRQMPARPIVETVPAKAIPSREESEPRTLSPTKPQTAHTPSLENVTPNRPSSLPPHAIEQKEVVRSVTQTVTQAQPNSPLRTEKIVTHMRDDHPLLQTAPLSQAALANRVAVEREPPPVVNVVIDRIEVRAARETPQLPAPRRAKPQPSVSLADYLGARR